MDGVTGTTFERCTEGRKLHAIWGAAVDVFRRNPSQQAQSTATTAAWRYFRHKNRYPGCRACKRAAWREINNH